MASTAPFPTPTKTWHDNTYAALSPTRPELSAAGKTILITGGGTGIGAETARFYALAGASRIALLGRREQPLLDTKAALNAQFPAVDIFTAPTDVTSKAAVDSAFAAFLGDGKVDVVISNAGLTGPMEPVGEVDPVKFLAAVQINIAGALHVAQAFLRYAAPGAVAISTNSSAAHLNFGPGFSSYNVAKIGVFRLWDSLAFANPQYSVFHVQPGVVDTDMNKAAGGVAAMGFEDHVSLPGSFNLWLSSPEAKFLSGKFLWTNWDVEELKARAKEIQGSRELTIDLVGWPFDKPTWSSPWDSSKQKQ